MHLPRTWTPSRRTCISAGAFTGYCLLALLLFGLPLLTGGGGRWFGVGFDSEIFIWGFAWVPHAIAHGLNPFVTHAVWTPDGANLTWTTTTPGLALLFAPLTVLAGPVAAFDVAALLMPALAAWTGFLLCRYLTRTTWPSLVGGFLFGFSGYMVAQERFGHLQLTSVFLVPLVVLALLRFLDGKTGGRRLTLELGPLLAFELLLSTEVAFTLTLALVVALAVAYLLAPERRVRLVALRAPLAAGYLLAAVLTSPFLYFLLSDFHTAFNPPGYSATDVVSLVVPGRMPLVGGSWFTGISRHFPNPDVEQEGYLGLPAFVVVALFAREGLRLRTSRSRFLLVSLLVALVATLGRSLVVLGRRLFHLPWALLQGLPAFDNVLSGRLALYLSLLVAVIVAMWSTRRKGKLCLALTALVVLAIFPNPSRSGVTTRYFLPPLFTDAAYRPCLAAGETILPVPQQWATLWQAEAGFRFRLAGGYLGPGAIPSSYTEPPDIAYVAQGNPVPAGRADILRSFVRSKHVTSLVIAPWDVEQYAGALRRLGATRLTVGGVAVYHFGPGPRDCTGSRPPSG